MYRQIIYAIVTVNLLLLSCQSTTGIETEFLLNVEVNVEQTDTISDFFEWNYYGVFCI